jgi:hypothetical protein
VREQRDDEFTDFVVEHAPRLLRTACLLTGDGHLGEDLLQTALAKAYGSWATVSGGRPPRRVRAPADRQRPPEPAAGKVKGPPAHPPEPAYPCCLPALGRFTG